VDEVSSHGDDGPTIGSGGTTAAGHSSYDTQCQKTFGHNTLETLPHADHYRNLLSATGHIRKRPTLLELHELSVCNLSIPNSLVSHFHLSSSSLLLCYVVLCFAVTTSTQRRNGRKKTEVPAWCNIN